ncbi:MAG: peptide chain release factor N(5)-glutamine methyltransferase [Anaerolineae bacterium]|nr:peptide chain release factor N(5)-glutamine methyltransferase [Anaerolineae bacterium]MCZ7552184.1 peptide chain release factor N(5)-glutamine methyltransferase [Anaerolineales bacterium]
MEQIKARLAPLSETAGLDAQTLLAQTFERSRAWVLAHPEARLTERQAVELERKLARLERGEPLPYVLGSWEFYGLEFAVSPAALIPRPETELLVDEALAWLSDYPRRRLAADVGTGSGCIAIVLTQRCPDLQVIASDISRTALELAQRNLSRHGVAGRVALVEADLLAPGAQKFDLICANLPYIPAGQLKSLRVSQWEPQPALNGGDDGLAQIRRLLAQAPERLARGGLMLLEIEERQGAAASALARRAFPQAAVSRLKDLAGKDRVVKIASIRG